MSLYKSIVEKEKYTRSWHSNNSKNEPYLIKNNKPNPYVDHQPPRDNAISKSKSESTAVRLQNPN